MDVSKSSVEYDRRSFQKMITFEGLNLFEKLFWNISIDNLRTNVKPIPQKRFQSSQISNFFSKFSFLTWKSAYIPNTLILIFTNICLISTSCIWGYQVGKRVLFNFRRQTEFWVKNFIGMWENWPKNSIKKRNHRFWDSLFFYWFDLQF